MKTRIPMLASLAFFVLSGCQPTANPQTPGLATSTTRFSHQDVLVGNVEHVPARYETKQEEYLCRMGAGMQVCKRNKRVFYAGGVEMHVRLSSRPQEAIWRMPAKTTFDPDDLVGQWGCAGVMEGTFGFVVYELAPGRC